MAMPKNNLYSNRVFNSVLTLNKLDLLIIQRTSNDPESTYANSDSSFFSTKLCKLLINLQPNPIKKSDCAKRKNEKP